MKPLQSSLVCLLALAIPTLASADPWRPVEQKATHLRAVGAAPSVPGIQIFANGYQLKIKGEVTGMSTLSKSMYGDVEVQTNAHPGAKFGATTPNPNRFAVANSAAVMAYPASAYRDHRGPDTAKVIADKLVATGDWKLVRATKDGKTAVIESTAKPAKK